MENAIERQVGDSSIQLSEGLAGRGDRTPRRGLVHLRLMPILSELRVLRQRLPGTGLLVCLFVRRGFRAGYSFLHEMT